MITNFWKHFGYALAAGIALYAFAYFGKAQGIGWFFNLAMLMATIYLEYRQWQRANKPFNVLLKQRGLDSLVDILAGNIGFFIGYNVLLKLTAGGWIA